MESVIYISVVLVFCLIVYKRKISPIIAKKKQDADKSAKTNATTTAMPLGVPAGNGAQCFIPGGVRTKYSILVFDYSCDALTPFEFGDRIQSRLSVSLSQIAELGCPYHVDFLTLGSALIVLISYQVSLPVQSSTPQAGT